MPANKKYLSSNWQRLLKITAGFIGGYLVTITLHMALALYVNHVNVMITMAFSGFILWTTLMIIAFIAKNGWKIWGIYLGVTLLFSVIIYFGNLNHPLVP